MNKRIRRKKDLLAPKLRVWPPLPDPVHFLQIWIMPGKAGIVPGYEQKMFSPVRRRSFRKGHQSTVERRRVELAIRRRARRDWRRQCRGKWLEPWLRGGHMHREEDWMPKP